VNRIIGNRMRSRKRRLGRRLARRQVVGGSGRRVLGRVNSHLELADKTVATSLGGATLAWKLVRKLKLAEEIDARVSVFRRHLPYHESDHVLNLAFNALCGGNCLDDLELRRQDEAYLNLLGAERVPDPTTAGDFCRRFQRPQLESLQAAIDAARVKVWQEQSPDFFAEACIEADGTLVRTSSECKQGVDYSYKGDWGYHPLVMTLAGTGEVLRLINRSGNRPSHEGAAQQFDQCIELCRSAGFRRILLRGDTDFSQTAHLDRWHEQGDVQFLFGYDCSHKLHYLADELPENAWKTLRRQPRYTVKTATRRKPPRRKQAIIEQRQFRDLRLQGEALAEFAYQPDACSRAYRMIVVRKDLEVHEPKQARIFDDYRYFFYLTNDWKSTAEKLVASANDRCQQENYIAQLQSLRALHAPVDTLLSNEAYMLSTSLAWNLKSWLALSLPESKADGPQRNEQRSEKQRLLRMEFRTFLNYFIRLPAQVLTTGRRLIVRLLTWNQWQPTFWRLAQAVEAPLRC
jgi:hypothetical protein